MSMPMPELCLSYAGMAQLPQGPRRPSSGQRSAHPLPSWPFTSCPPSSRLSALSALTLLTLISRCLFTPLPRRLASSPLLSVPSVSVIFFHLRRGVCLCSTRSRCSRRVGSFVIVKERANRI